MSEALERICREAHEAIDERRQHPRSSPTAWSGRGACRSPRCWPSPPSTTTSCARARACAPASSLESGEPREVHHFATLIGYGASAINPYLMLETLDELVLDQRAIMRPGADGAAVALGAEEAAQNVVKAIGKGLLKTISKMGISTIQSYCGAQIFEAVGLERELIDTHFTGTASRIGGVGLDVLARRGARAPRARLPGCPQDDLLPVGGVYAWRRDGEHHMWNPETIALVQHAVRSANGDVAGGAEGRRARRSRRCATAPAFEKYREYAQRGQRGRGAQGDAARAAARSAAAAATRRARSRSRRSSRRARSSSASAPAR